MQEMVNVILLPVLFKHSAFNVGRKWEEITVITLSKKTIMALSAEKIVSTRYKGK